MQIINLTLVQSGHAQCASNQSKALHQLCVIVLKLVLLQELLRSSALTPTMQKKSDTNYNLFWVSAIYLTIKGKAYNSLSFKSILFR